MDNLHLEYKGYTCTLEYKGNRLYGYPCPPGCPDKPVGKWMFAGDDIEQAGKLFKEQVDWIIVCKEYEERQEAWEKQVDHKSIASVLNILPDVFEKRVVEGMFDHGLLDKVVGGDYEVPLYYVTKAWDELLKGSLGSLAFKIGPEEDDDYSEEELLSFISEMHVKRIRAQAIEDNDKMKGLWKKHFGIDIDSVRVDFTKFDKHLPPNVSEHEYCDYFMHVLDGVDDWIMSPINYPSEDWALHDAVSALMEFAAQIITIERVDW